MLDSVALDEAISNFRDVATSLDMTSGHGELLTDTQQYTAQLDDVNTSASYMIFCQCCVSSVCLLYRIYHYHIAQAQVCMWRRWVWLSIPCVSQFFRLMNADERKIYCTPYPHLASTAARANEVLYL